MSPRLLVTLALLSASCGGTTDTTGGLTPHVRLDTTIPGVTFRDAEAFAYEIQDGTSAPYHSVFVSTRESRTRCVPGGMDWDRAQPAFSLRFRAGRKPGGTWIPNVASRTEDYVSEDSTSATVTRGRAEGDHVEVEADLLFPRGAVRGTVVAVICR